MKENPGERELNEYQIRNIRILIHLLESEAVSDEVVDYLRQSELDYFSLLDKYKLLELKANIDEKTNLLKFKADYLSNILKTASRIYFGLESQHYYVSLVRFDIDDFSVFNNRYGHDIGDKILFKISDVLRENSRPTDYLIRFGGEELDALLPSTNIDGAIKYTKMIFEKLENIELQHEDQILSATVSAGLSCFEYQFNKKKFIDEMGIEKCYKDLQIEADNALYEAKYLGKNRFCVYSKDKIDEYAKIRKLYVKNSR